MAKSHVNLAVTASLHTNALNVKECMRQPIATAKAGSPFVPILTGPTHPTDPTARQPPTQVDNHSKSTVATPIKVEKLAFWLQGYDNEAQKYLLDGFSEGFKIPFKGEVKSTTVQNLKSAAKHSTVVDQYIAKELQKDRISGPYNSLPFETFHISPVGVVPKKQPGDFRVIHHLSYPEGSSINDGIDPEFSVVHYPSIETALKLIKEAGQGAAMAKSDIKSAFRIIPIHPQHHHLFCFEWNGHFFFDKCLQMGCSVSCQLFEQFSTALQWVAQHKQGIAAMTHMLDDFFFVNKSVSACKEDLNAFLRLCEDINVPIAKEKTFLPDKVMTFLGYEIDSINSEVRLPQEKICKCKTYIQDMLQKKKAKLCEIQSLIGLLNFACGVVVPGRAFLRRLINLTIGVKKAYHHIRLSQEVKKDLSVWLNFLHSFNGKSLFRDEMFLNPGVCHLFTDAAKEWGFGAILGKSWFNGQWETWWKDQNITLLELVPIVLAIETWGRLLMNKAAVFHTDNQALVSVINKQTSKESHVMTLVRRLVTACLLYNIMCRAEHVPGRANQAADALSRLQVPKFRQLQPEAEFNPSPFPKLPASLP